MSELSRRIKPINQPAKTESENDKTDGRKKLTYFLEK
jgi:hypothetical protein